ncbi:MAG: RNA-directed DNA polymerase [Candidatus Paceibacterota bacterium]
MKPDTLVARALNAARVAHLPTYAALRALIESSVDSKRVKWITDVVVSKTTTRKEWRYYDFPILKELDGDGTAAYRDCTLGSPTTLLAEAHVLHLLSHLDEFAVPEGVYSYHWPYQERGSRNFQYFYDGYTSRNHKIAELLTKNPRHVAVVTDIRHFYPSVDWDALQARFARRLKLANDPSTTSKAMPFLNSLRESSTQGIPIGPDFGHLLGHVALEDVDASLHVTFGERYFRYVDDIIVVCSANEADKVATAIASTVSESDLKVHKGKDDIVASPTWLSDCPSAKNTDNDSPFNALVRDLTVYLMLKPSSFDSIRKVFANEGFSIPLERVKANSKYGPFRRFVQYRHLSGIVDTARLYFWKESDFVVRAAQVRDELSESLEKLVKNPPPTTGMGRRWYIQKWRYHLNRLLYLLPRSSHSRLQSYIPEGPEFAEHRILLAALSSGDATMIAKLPGRAVAFFCELTSEHLVPEKSHWEALEDRAIAESASAMALYFGWEFGSDELSGMYQGSRKLLEACSTGVADREQIRPHSYLDEVELLLRATKPKDRERYVRTRADEDETIGLEGLRFGERNDFS